MLKIPTEPSAIKVLNSLVKNFGATRFRARGDSNPYDTTQCLTGQLHPQEVDGLRKILEAQGWKEQDFGSPGTVHRSEAGATIAIDDNGRLTVYGRKPAKRNPRPLYD